MTVDFFMRFYLTRKSYNTKANVTSQGRNALDTSQFSNVLNSL